MRCWLVRRRLIHYDDGDLPVRQMNEIQEHLRTCEACSTELTQLRRAIALVESLPQVDTSAEFTAGVLAAIRARRLAEPPAAPVTWPAAVAVGFAGLVISAAVIVGVLSLDWESVGKGVVALAPSVGAVLHVVGSAVVQFLQTLETTSQALAEPARFVLLADIALLLMVAALWRRLVTARSSTGMGSILAL